MPGTKRKRRYNRSSSKTRNPSKRSCRVRTKNLEIFVTDFLTDPCGLPVELRDCVLIDGRTPVNDHPSDICSSNNSHVLKKIFDNNESIERLMKNSATLLADEMTKKLTGSIAE